MPVACFGLEVSFGVNHNQREWKTFSWAFYFYHYFATAALYHLWPRVNRSRLLNTDPWIGEAIHRNVGISRIYLNHSSKLHLLTCSLIEHCSTRNWRYASSVGVKQIHLNPQEPDSVKEKRPSLLFLAKTINNNCLPLKWRSEIQLVSKEIEAAKAKAQDTLVALVKGFDNFFDGVTNFIREFDSVEADQSMDAGDDMGAVDMVPTLMFESNTNSKAKALINIAEAKGLSSVIVDNDYDAW